MKLVQLTPTGAHLSLVPELSRRRGATELDERRIGAVPQIEQFRVDPPTLTRFSA